MRLSRNQKGKKGERGISGEEEREKWGEVEEGGKRMTVAGTVVPKGSDLTRRRRRIIVR